MFLAKIKMGLHRFVERVCELLDAASLKLDKAVNPFNSAEKYAVGFTEFNGAYETFILQCVHTANVTN